MDSQQRVFDVLSQAGPYRDFETAFEQATAIRISFEAAESYISPRIQDGDQFRFRFLPRPLQFLTERSDSSPKSEMLVLDWARNIHEAIVAVHVGEQLLGILRTGCVLSPEMCQKQLRNLFANASTSAQPTLPILPKRKLAAIGRILVIFGDYLSIQSNQLMLRQSTCEPAIISRAKQFIAEHHRENILLEDVANYAHVSSFYLCKLFKKVLHLNFSDFLTRTRIETAKELLQNRNRRINEVALEAGFQSLTNFNRVFKQVLGRSPRQFRNQMSV